MPSSTLRYPTPRDSPNLPFHDDIESLTYNSDLPRITGETITRERRLVHVDRHGNRKVIVSTKREVSADDPNNYGFHSRSIPKPAQPHRICLVYEGHKDVVCTIDGDGKMESVEDIAPQPIVAASDLPQLKPEGAIGVASILGGIGAKIVVELATEVGQQILQPLIDSAKDELDVESEISEVSAKDSVLSIGRMTRRKRTGRSERRRR